MNLICRNKNNKAFTLIELLVVVAIIGILASVVLVSLNTARAKTRDARRISDMRALQAAIELAKTDGIQLPYGYNFAANILTGILVPNYIPSVPIESWTDKITSSTYYYCNSNTMGDSGFCHNDADMNTYAIGFYTETSTSLGPAGGWYCSTSEGIFKRQTGNVPGSRCLQR